jgi:hypothetical protein
MQRRATVEPPHQALVGPTMCSLALLKFGLVLYSQVGDGMRGGFRLKLVNDKALLMTTALLRDCYSASD